MAINITFSWEKTLKQVNNNQALAMEIVDLFENSLHKIQFTLQKARGKEILIKEIFSQLEQLNESTIYVCVPCLQKLLAIVRHLGPNKLSLSFLEEIYFEITHVIEAIERHKTIGSYPKVGCKINIKKAA